MTNNRGGFFKGTEGTPSGSRSSRGTPTGGGVESEKGNFFTGAQGSPNGSADVVPGTPTGTGRNQDTYVVSGTFDGTDREVDLLRNDGTTITVDLASLYTYIDTKNLSGTNWVESTKTLTINQGARSVSQRITGFATPDMIDNSNYYTTGGTYSNSRITFNRNDDSDYVVDLSALVDSIPTDTRNVSIAFSADSDNIIITDSNDSEISLDVSNLRNANTTVDNVFGVSNVQTGQILKKTATGWEADSEAAAPTFTDTSNSGTTLGVNFTFTNGVVTATVDASALPDSDTTYTAGTGIEITNNVISSTVVDTNTTYTFASGSNGSFKFTPSGGTETTVNTGGEANPTQYIKEIVVNSNGTLTVTDQDDSDVVYTPNVGLTTVAHDSTLAGSGTSSDPLKVDSDSIGYGQFDETATFSEDHAGLVPHAAGSDNKFINENAQWVSVLRAYFDQTGSVFQAGATGTVPAPTTEDVTNQKVLSAGGTWIGGTDGGSSIGMQDQYGTDSEVQVTRLQISSTTGFELVSLGGSYYQLRERVPPPPVNLNLAGVPSNYSWFSTADSETVTVTATNGSVSRITSASISNSGPTVTIDNSEFDLRWTRGLVAGTFTLSVSATVIAAADSDSESKDASGSWTVYRDFFFNVNQASGTITTPFTTGRNQENLANGEMLTCTGHTYLDVPDGVTFTLTDAFGVFPINEVTPTDVSYTVNGVTKSYDRYYLGEYDSNIFTVGGVSG